MKFTYERYMEVAVVITIIAIFAAILFPVFAQARKGDKDIYDKCIRAGHGVDECDYERARHWR